MIAKDSTVLIVGLGLIGGSYARGLKQHGYRVYAISRGQDTIDYALENGIIDAGSIQEDSELIAAADFVVFGLYPKVMCEWIARNGVWFKSGAILTDVSGVKCGIVERAQTLLERDDVEFIASHPMAGREVSGVENSDASLFLGANFLITPTEKNTDRGILFVREMAELLGFGRVTVLTPREHDKMIGFVSQLTHAVAVSLMNTSDNTHLKEYTGDSFRELTRIAKINGELWSELFFLNKENLVSEIDDFIAELERLKETIAKEDAVEIKRLFAQAAQRRSKFDQ